MATSINQIPEIQHQPNCNEDTCYCVSEAGDPICSCGYPACCCHCELLDLTEPNILLDEEFV